MEHRNDIYRCQFHEWWRSVIDFSSVHDNRLFYWRTQTQWVGLRCEQSTEKVCWLIRLRQHTITIDRSDALSMDMNKKQILIRGVPITMPVALPVQPFPLLVWDGHTRVFLHNRNPSTWKYCLYSGIGSTSRRSRNKCRAANLWKLTSVTICYNFKIFSNISQNFSIFTR